MPIEMILRNCKESIECDTNEAAGIRLKEQAWHQNGGATWLCQFTVIVSNNLVVMPIHEKSNEHLGDNDNPRNYNQLGGYVNP